MKVKCVNNQVFDRDLILNKEYEVIKEEPDNQDMGNWIFIQDETGDVNSYLDFRFEKVS